ncbi:MAG: sugar transferase [Flavobacteriaceae bacterium]|jgi:lipopolysaccharide/colanic/teichoic acid biosynthesis glycosyltransferase|nr:sugar transferase [Flavobacteriaceae bacterium]
MYLIIKRFFDLVLAFVAILCLLPILVPIILGLLFTGEGYVFYKQKRVGINKKIFYIYKFATMLKDSPNLSGGIITTKNDPRITPFGGFLRKTKINELPQLLNILFGQMSVVGPRPVMQKSFDAYPEDVKSLIYNIKPGLTGIGSIIFRDEEVLINDVKVRGDDAWEFYKKKIYPFKGKIELWYQKRMGFLLDFKLIILTAWVILFPKSKIYEKLFKDLPKRNF